jgi:hypothetical protein
MAYGDLQKRDVAREVARAGGNLALAERRLREEYELFRTIGQSTIRRLMRDSGFAALVAEQAKMLVDAASDTAATVERERARRESQGSHLQRLAADDAILEQARSRIADLLKDPEKVDPSMAMRILERFAALVERRKDKVIPVLAGTREATWLVEAVQEEVLSRFPQATAKEIIVGIRQRYVEKSEATRGASAGC